MALTKDSNSNKLNIRYLGFEGAAGGGRRLDFSVTAPGQTARRVSCEIPASAFTGASRITFQESAAVCYEKLRDVLEREREIQDRLCLRLTDADIQQYRPRRRRAAVRKA